MPLVLSRAVCFYASEVEDKGVAHVFGVAMLLHIGEGGAVSILGKYRFAQGYQVSRLTATLTSHSTMVLGYRALHPSGDNAATSDSRELSAAFVSMEGNELAVSAGVLHLEPGRRDMWGRAVSLVSQNLVAYSYQSAAEKKTKTAILRVDSESHAITLVGGPRVISEGSAAFVQAITLDPGMQAPHSFTYFQHPGQKSQAEVCRIAATGAIESCGKAAWADQELHAASAARLPDGRLFFAYANAELKPFVQIFGPQEFLS